MLRFTRNQHLDRAHHTRQNMSANPGKLLKNLVELVGLEPTASSLRTTRSPS